jgi:hypothetical protein
VVEGAVLQHENENVLDHGVDASQSSAVIANRS